jgi:predicted dienelactone hydrolase
MDSKEPRIFAGSRQLQVTDEEKNISFPVLIQYPTLSPSVPTSFGPYTMDVSIDAPVQEGQFPLVIISHGNSGSPFAYRTISMLLANHGYIVALPEHYGNNRNNNELEKSIENLQYRPRHVSLVIDYLLSGNIFGENISSRNIAVAGHSFGGYTALAAAGGEPRTQTGEKISVQKDDRISALVLMAPAAAYFLADHSLDNVTVPIFLLVAEHDQFTPKEWTTDVIEKRIPDSSKLVIKTIAGAGHFSFISPFPPAIKNPGFLPSTDPEGFDREEFHTKLPWEILAFLNNTLKEK